MDSFRSHFVALKHHKIRDAAIASREIVQGRMVVVVKWPVLVLWSTATSSIWSIVRPPMSGISMSIVEVRHRRIVAVRAGVAILT